ncbi:MAG: sigma-70 family RNA polymerase sigma factor [Leptospira sp.]|nr:sigma-70 family RNA polymerase sigma factor [Leptospira sp.]
MILSAREGSKSALENLVKKHQHYIYNVALKMTLSPYDAEDVTQEVLIKMITNLSQFRGESQFRTWLYRITFNHFLKMKKVWLEDRISNFDDYGKYLDGMKNHDLTETERLEMKDLIEESKISCMSGMLLCLSREQRLIYVLGEIFKVDHTIGSEMLIITKVNFRKKLSRARKDLTNFMNQKCGLINKSNPCRCARKTKSFIQEGWVDKEKMKFNIAYVQRIHEASQEKSNMLNMLMEGKYANLFREHPFQEKDHWEKLNLLSDPDLKEIFNFK